MLCCRRSTVGREEVAHSVACSCRRQGDDRSIRATRQGFCPSIWSASMSSSDTTCPKWAGPSSAFAKLLIISGLWNLPPGLAGFGKVSCTSFSFFFWGFLYQFSFVFLIFGFSFSLFIFSFFLKCMSAFFFQATCRPSIKYTLNIFKLTFNIF